MDVTKKKNINDNGITLIALVVTIVILLILSGIAIAMLSGNNGIITQTKEAKKSNVEGEVIEKIKIAVDSARVEAKMKSMGDKKYVAQEHLEDSAKIMGKDLNQNEDLISTKNKYQLVCKTGDDNGTITITYGKTTKDDDKTAITGGNDDYAEACNNKDAVIEAVVTVTKNNFEITSLMGSKIQNSTDSSGTEDLLNKDKKDEDSGGGSGGDNSTTFPKATVGTATTKLSTIDGKDYSSKNPPIPQGYTALDYGDATWANASTTYNKGLVISDSTTANSGNEWVWVPVADATTMYTTGSATLLGTTATTNKYTKSEIISGKTRVLPGTSGYREPDLVNCDTDSQFYKTILGFASTQKMAETFVSEYENMIASITKYGGFYIGRYELSSVGTKKNQATLTNTNWYNLYQSCKSLAQTGSNTTSRMIYGCQWDVTCNWLSGSEYNISDSTSWGNYSNNTATGHGSKQNTGYSESWKANNIYDLAGNCWEWTQEAVGFRADRGGGYDSSGSHYPASYRGSYDPDDSNDAVRFSPHFNIEPIIVKI